MGIIYILHVPDHQQLHRQQLINDNQQQTGRQVPNEKDDLNVKDE
ncbi:hypothetical protein [Schinkia azotoformans]|nr:hypothetical protein [Schinkia azotoformans]MEC1697738.1 hypothetical protein [Schinkia azotoformans]